MRSDQCSKGELQPLQDGSPENSPPHPSLPSSAADPAGQTRCKADSSGAPPCVTLTGQPLGAGWRKMGGGLEGPVGT